MANARAARRKRAPRPRTWRGHDTHRDGCRGFTGPIPPPLWMSVIQLCAVILAGSCPVVRTLARSRWRTGPGPRRGHADTQRHPRPAPPGQIASPDMGHDHRPGGYSSHPTGARCRSRSTMTGSCRSGGAAAGWSPGSPRSRARPTCSGSAPRSATRTARRPAGPPAGCLAWTGRRAAPGCRCSTSRPGPSSARTTRWPTPPSGSSTTCSTTRRTSRISGWPSAGSGTRSALTTPRSPRRWPPMRARARLPTRPAARPLRAAIQDYHLTLVPRMLAELRPDIRIAHFTHTPWAPPEYYRMLPDAVGREVLAGILGADHAGFLCQRWADAFLDCCEVILGAAVDRARQQVSYDGQVTGVGVHPLGVRGRRADRPRRRAGRAGQGRCAGRGGGRPAADRQDRPHRAVQEHRPRPGRLPGAAGHSPGVARPGDARGVRLPVPA